jgi:hypothetical protein
VTDAAPDAPRPTAAPPSATAALRQVYGRGEATSRALVLIIGASAGNTFLLAAAYQFGLHGWLVLGLPWAAFILGRYLDVSPLTSGPLAFLSGLSFQLLLTTANAGLESLVAAPEDAVVRPLAALAGLGIAATCAWVGTLFARAAQERDAEVARGRAQAYRAFAQAEGQAQPGPPPGDA